MNLTLKQTEELIIPILTKIGYSTDESQACYDNMLEAEMAGKKTHGFIRVNYLKKLVETGEVVINGDEISIAKETPVSLLIDGKKKVGLYVVTKAVEKGIQKAKLSGICIVGTTNTSAITGMIAAHTRQIANEDLISIAFNNSSGGLIPHGAIKEMLGTNPLTVGIPTNTDPVILDMSSSQKTFGYLLNAKLEGRSIPEGIALDAEGNVTTDPSKAMDGGLLPFAEHKGSGLAFIVELLGGALTGSRVGNNIEGGWGSLFIIINPNILRPLGDFKDDVESAIAELKALPKAKGVDEIFYPGEQSNRRRAECIKKDEIEISDALYKNLTSI